ncbi:CPBP family intramembrane glutamic endopeptidase [Aeromicrobium alkaliterrae]|uniref:CPBP family intramembrane metalloprotease n=1 Tax=Aeromicrobium alkaliterrae TaxID=302168 RepID=A0ABN2KAW9_9ACTN
MSVSTPYHRLAREHPDHAWWKLPVAGVIGVAGYGVAVVCLVLVGVIAVLIASDGDLEAVDSWLDGAGSTTLGSPGELAFLLIFIGLMLPAVVLGVLATGPRPVGYLSSVEGRLRWGWLARLSAVAFLVYTAMILGSLAMGLGGEITAPSLENDAVAVFLVALLLTPTQAAAEEYVFRGYLLQLIGSWTRWAIIPVLVSTPLFVAGHVYEFWGLVDVGVFGLLACWLVIRTGGLEAAIAAHVANNVVLSTLEAFNMFALTSDEYGAVDVLPTVVTSILFALLVEWMVRRSGLQRTRPPLPPKPPPPPVWIPAYPHPYPYPYPPQAYPPVHPGYYPYPSPPQAHPPAPAPSYPPVPPPPGGTP